MGKCNKHTVFVGAASLVAALLFLCFGEASARSLRSGSVPTLPTTSVPTLPTSSVQSLSTSTVPTLRSCGDTLPSEATPDSLGFNALRFSMQKRYRPANAPFKNERFLDNTFIRADAGSWSLFPSENCTYSFGPAASLAFGKNYSPLNAFSLGVNAREIRRNADAARNWSIGVEAGHSLDLTGLLHGYDPARILSVSTFGGVGVDYCRTTGIVSDHKNAFDFYFRFALDFRAQVSRDWDIYFRPAIILGSEGLSNRTASTRCETGYGFSFGLLKYFNRLRVLPCTCCGENFCSEEAPGGSSEGERPRTAFGRWLCGGGAYAGISAGAQLQASDLVTETVGLWPSARETIALSYGRTLEGPLGARVSVFYGRDIWKEFSGGRQVGCYYGGGRPELLFDPIWWTRSAKKWFSLPLIFGAEAGLMIKPDDGYTIRRLYLGLCGGVQAAFHITKRSSIFIEPRFSLVPYSWKSRSSFALVNSLSNYYDTLFSLSIGYTISLSR